MPAEVAIRIGFFLGALALFSALEALFPRRKRSRSRLSRWPSNLGIVAVSAMLTRLVLPIAPVGLALWCTKNEIGFFHLILLAEPYAGALSILLLDMAIYWQHRLSHVWTPFWRIHRMHHADIDIDATTALRFHPIEILLSLVYKLGLVILLGPPAWAVLTFEVLLNACATFNHANMALPLPLDRFMRLFIVTPDMHRVHHSTDMREANMNLGFNFPWWDRAFGTYKSQPDDGHTDMRIGMNILRKPEDSRLDKLLLIPFR